ncbi:protein kinase domain-containing protein [Gordonia terrae]|uniref:non-specific serine/threonine protein kinase n=2 Tax=Gordonia terrae TaxID=2055 RepID=A0AAD0NW88_9ACTN|nr:protein kinase [Gordonia terrae]VTR07446.1 serine/threonine protein kinase [Clostridioides difficile]ANY24074.1 serine/threonine protein kinase [Gordonia terrae]AWO84816.1 serine/threonine protein kinase [Gordonia terrae]VTS56868.1 Probable serine/threonine-protein kinase pknH [Gordonia terrae]GAB46076.1 putative serine/threonine protein kinase/peptidyl-prolyl cis-trans isomerase [Gordonia terrae NBRC 100016]
MSDPSSRAGTTLGPYRIDRLLGRGGMGEVYEAYDTVRERRVALKLLPPHLVHDKDFRERFERESKTAAKLSDPHVIPIHDWGEKDGVLFIDMRLVDGQDLRKLLADGPLPAARAVAILGQVASALDAAHRGGLVHRDIKPDNILVDADDFAYLVDFGIAQGTADSRLTQIGTALGTLAYMAPERFGDDPAGPSSDNYALACVLYECVTGQTPYPAKTDQGLMTAHITKEPPTMGGPLDPVIARGLAKDPAHRYPTARELLRAASTALTDPPPSSAPPTVTPRIVTPPPMAPPPTAPPTYAPGGSGSDAFGKPGGPVPSDRTIISPGTPPAGQPGARGFASPPEHSGPQRHSSHSGPPQHSGPRQHSGSQRFSGPQQYSGPQQFSGPQQNSGPQQFSGPTQWGGAPTPAPRKSNTGRNVAIAVGVGLVVIALAVTGIVVVLSGSGGDDSPTPSTSTSAIPAGTVTCDYPQRTAVGGITEPAPAASQPNTGTVEAQIPIAGQGTIDLTLDRAEAPCNVGAMVSLIKSGFYDNSKCHRASRQYLICGSSGGREGTNPGWTSPDELPENLPSAGTDDGVPQVTYPRGTVGILDLPDDEGATGSTTFFLLADDTRLPLTYSIAGTIDPSGLAVLDKVLAGGFTPTRPGAASGPPNQNLLIQKATVSE